MPSKAKLLLIAVLALLILIACRRQVISSPTLPTATDTQTPLGIATATPTPLPATPSISNTATSLSPTEAPMPPLANLYMLDEKFGWAWSATGRLLHTSDGGQTWIDRTPEGFQYIDSGSFLDAQSAWVPVYLPDNNSFGLLHTSDGGQSWVQYPQGPASGLHFTDAMHGWAVSGDYGAGNVYFHLSQTNDGGKTWTTIPVSPPLPEPGLELGTIHLCNMCNDAFYYDPDRLVIVYGDLGSMEPSDSVTLEISSDLGNTWQSQYLALPQGEADALIVPNPPIFFNPFEGLLPVHLIKMNPDGSYGEQRLVFYVTSDNGASWHQLPALLDEVPKFASIHADSSRDIFVICGSTLCASDDAARTWHKVRSDLDFTQTDTRAISALNFVNGSTGWALLQESGTNSLYHTTDGGTHWVELSPHLAPAPAPIVTIISLTPTPTQIPDA